MGEVDGLSQAETVARVLLGAHAEGGALEASFLSTDDAVLHEVAASNGSRARGGAFREIEAVVDHWRALKQGVLPIGALAKAGRVGQLRQGNEASRCSAFVHQDGVLLRIEQSNFLPRLLEAIVGVVGHLGRLAFGALLGGDEDDTVATTCTVDGGRGGVLQYRDGLDIGGVQVVDAS